MTASSLRGEKKNKFPVQMARNCAIMISILAVWQFGMGQMDRKDHIEAEATAAVSVPEYFALQRLSRSTIYGPPISSYEVPGNGMQSAYTIVGQHNKRMIQ
jgi:hypothetical protein